MRSYFVSDLLTYTRTGRDGDAAWATDWELWSGNGTLSFARLHSTLAVFGYDLVGGAVIDSTPEPGWIWLETEPVDPTETFMDHASMSAWGFGWEWEGPTGPDGYRVGAVSVPLWFIAVLFVVMPLARLYRRVRRQPAGHCVSCGYDLRATPDRCPECGVSSAPATA